MLSAAGTGFVTAFTLILAIGAQNAFVLRQWLMRAHVFWLCLLCALSDAILIAAGVFGFGALVALLATFPRMMSLGGAVFLLVYGALRFLSAYRGEYHMVIAGKSVGLWATLAVGAAFTWLNPHVYLDTLGLIGAISTRYSEIADRLVFGIGAASASFVFFFSLGYGAQLLAPIMQSARAWRLLDLGIGAVMWMLALGLIFG